MSTDAQKYMNILKLTNPSHQKRAQCWGPEEHRYACGCMCSQGKASGSLLPIYLDQKPLQNVTFLIHCIVPVSPWQQGWEPVDTEATLGVSCCGTLQENRRKRNGTNRLATLLSQQRWHPRCRSAGCPPEPATQPTCRRDLAVQHSSQHPNACSSQGSLVLVGTVRTQEPGQAPLLGSKTSLLPSLTLEATTSALFPTGHTTTIHSCSRSTGTSTSHSDSIS